MKRLVLAAALAALAAMPAHARTLKTGTFVERVLQCTSSPCVITDNQGGNMDLFEAAAEEVRRTKMKIIINGPCMSACAWLADAARPYVSIGRWAKFGFHQIKHVWERGRPGEKIWYTNPTFTPALAAWLRTQGPLPDHTLAPIELTAADAAWYGLWPVDDRYW